MALAVLAIEGAHNVGLGVPELELCKGLTEVLRAFRSEFGVVDVLSDSVVGPNKPVKDESQVNTPKFKIQKPGTLFILFFFFLNKHQQDLALSNLSDMGDRWTGVLVFFLMLFQMFL